ncbi:amino acid ABC transporter permease [Kerstersia similis]|uniref:amino acid ABC transporter permease n=1 Tax=Kerstersia similis TaxID=206505 RepID=UPI0039EE748F
MFADWLAPKYLDWLFEGFKVTLLLSVLACVAATVLGAVLCLARYSRWRAVRLPVSLGLSFFRNTPLLVQLFFWYFGVSALLPQSWMLWLNSVHRLEFGVFGVQWPSFEFLAGWWGLTLYTTAFIAEELRAGIQAVPQGQWEAGRALGLPGRDIWRQIVLPQAFRISMPPLLGQYMNAVKNSSLTMAIGLAELSYASRQVETETFKTFQAFGVATLLYIAIIAVIEAVGYWMQHRYRLKT